MRILGDEAPHPVDSDANDAVRERLLTEIKALGFEPIVRDEFHCNEGRRTAACTRVQNVMFWVGDTPAENTKPNTVMIASHYDSVPTGPGAADDGSGIAASLEIARVLKSRELKKPVLVMITDGEEIGLVGASSFVKTDPLAKYIGAVVSMEARGVSGPVSLIETSRPNSRDIRVLKSNIKKPIASSLAADIYALMPNGTDVTEYLELDIDAANLALGTGAEFYHTPRDNLAMLDKRSLFHMGAHALSGVEAFIDADTSMPETQKIYTDVWGLFIITLPQILAAFIFAASIIVTVAALAKAGAAHRWKALLFPLAAVILGVGLSVLLTWGVNVIRPETHFAAAHPWALRGVQNIAALLGALIGYRLLARHASKHTLIISGWVWMTILLGAAFMLPGAAILFVPPLIIALIGLAALILGKTRIATIILALGAMVFTSFGVEVSAMGEIMLFPEYAAPFTIFVALSFSLIAPLTLKPKSSGAIVPRSIFIGAAISLAVFTIAAAIVPAYSVDAPRGLSVDHIAPDKNTSETASYRVRGLDPVPSAMNAVANFTADGEDQRAKAPPVTSIPLDVQTTVSGAITSLTITAPTADTVALRIDDPNQTSRTLRVNSQTLDNSTAQYINCVGRTCRKLHLSLPASEGASITIHAYRYGLGEQSRALLDARPSWALPQHRGDRRRVSKTIQLPQ